jgi:group II intron reverse transcriptase/maturase
MARRRRGEALTTLAHHIDEALLREAYQQTRKDGAVGIDRETAAEFARGLRARLQDLLERFKSGQYRAPAVRRVHIPKANGGVRPLGIPTFEDKVLQRAVAMVLGAVYEQDFLPCSFGFRPGRSAHGALAALREHLTELEGGWVLEVDIRSFFDTIDHRHLQAILAMRVRDGVLQRIIGKWLNAGVMEGGTWTRTAAGTPQGGVISPLLANVYLHEVLDQWFERVVKARMRGRAYLVRYADDFVMVFENYRDACRVWKVLPKRFGKYGLELHPDKTRLVRFRRPYLNAGPKGRSPRGRPPQTFDFLGFTIHWGRNKRKWWVVMLRTAKTRLRRAIGAVWEWCRRWRHRPLAQQHKKLCEKVRGHFSYFGLSGNGSQVRRLYHAVRRSWRYWLDRRSQNRSMSWADYEKLLERLPLPFPRLRQLPKCA